MRVHHEENPEQKMGRAPELWCPLCSWLIKMCKDKKIFITEQATDENPGNAPSSIYDSMYEVNQATDSHDNTYDHMYEDD